MIQRDEYVKLISRFLMMVAIFLLAGCTVTGPADDGYERGGEWADNGRILNDETRTVFRSGEEKQRPNDSRSSAGSTVGHAGGTIDAKIPEHPDFVLYQQWLDARKNNSPDYQKFKKWMEFEQFERWNRQHK